MNRVALVAAALAAAGVAVPAEAATVISFTLSGIGRDDRAPFYDAATGSGSVTFDESQSVVNSNGTFFGYTGPGSAYSLSVDFIGQVIGDNLYINFAANNRGYEYFTLNVQFQPGSLSGRLPTVTDFSSFVSGFATTYQVNPIRGNTNSAFGAVTSLRILKTEGGPGAFGGSTSSGTGSFERAAVPEPSTWTLLLAGFGVAGYAMRRRRASSVFSRAA